MQEEEIDSLYARKGERERENVHFDGCRKD